MSNKQTTKKQHSSNRDATVAKAGKRAGRAQVIEAKVNLNKVFAVLRQMSKKDFVFFDRNRAIQAYVELLCERGHLNSAERAEVKVRIASMALKLNPPKEAREPVAPRSAEQRRTMESHAHLVLKKMLKEN